jgi:hypothetical protein
MSAFFFMQIKLADLAVYLFEVLFNIGFEIDPRDKARWIAH